MLCVLCVLCACCECCVRVVCVVCVFCVFCVLCGCCVCCVRVVEHGNAIELNRVPHPVRFRWAVARCNALFWDYKTTVSGYFLLLNRSDKFK